MLFYPKIWACFSLLGNGAPCCSLIFLGATCLSCYIAAFFLVRYIEVYKWDFDSVHISFVFFLLIFTLQRYAVSL